MSGLGALRAIIDHRLLMLAILTPLLVVLGAVEWACDRAHDTTSRRRQRRPEPLDPRTVRGAGTDHLPVGPEPPERRRDDTDEGRCRW